jgi:hypothetical protein
MGKYRTSRNLEASIIDFIKEKLTEANWSNINVEKTFSRIYGLQMDENKETAAICVRASDTSRKRIEVGSDLMLRSELILIDIFATSDGQRLDLVDFLVGVLIKGMPYYEYQTDKSNVMTKIQNGQIRFLTMDDKPVNLNMDKSSLEVQDRYRHLISATVSLGRVEC